MTNFSDILGTLMQSGMSASTTGRLEKCPERRRVIVHKPFGRIGRWCR